MSTLVQMLLVISFFFFALYNYLDNLNDLTRIRLALPQIQQLLHEESIEYQQLRDEWARLSSASELYKLQKQSGWRHLREYHEPITLPSCYLPSSHAPSSHVSGCNLLDSKSPPASYLESTLPHPRS